MKSHHFRSATIPTFSSAGEALGSTRLDRWVLGRIQGLVPGARIRFVLWDGYDLQPPSATPVVTIAFKNRRALLSWIWDPDLNFGEAYMFGAVEIRGDLVRLLEEIYRARKEERSRWWRWQKSHDVRTSRENVHHHYDLGNDFYRLWLDREMVYTCAYFPTAGLHARGGAESRRWISSAGSFG